MTFVNIRPCSKGMMMKLKAAAVIAGILCSPAPLLGHGQAGAGQIAGAKNAKVTQVYQHAIPGVPGKSIKGVLVEYGPGGYSPAHRHAPSAIIYATVLEGSVRCQLNGGKETTYTAGQNWTELPGDHHNVSANASQAEPATVLAVFVVNDEDPALTIPDGQ